MAFEKNVNQHNKDPLLSFREAAAKGDLIGLQNLMGTNKVKKAQIDEPGTSSGKTALHRAAKNGHDDVICYLLELGANPTKTDKEDNKTAFQLYCENIGYCVPNNWVFGVENINTINPRNTWERMALESAKRIVEKQEKSEGKKHCACYGSGDIYVGTIQETALFHLQATERTQEMRKKFSL